MEAAEYTEFIDGILVGKDNRLLRRCKTPYQVNPEIPEDIVNAGARLHIAIPMQGSQAIVGKILQVQFLIIGGEVSPDSLYIPELP